MKYTNIKKLLIKFMGGGLINFPTRFLRWVKIDGDAEGDDEGGDGGDSGGSTEVDYEAIYQFYKKQLVETLPEQALEQIIIPEHYADIEPGLGNSAEYENKTGIWYSDTINYNLSENDIELFCEISVTPFPLVVKRIYTGTYKTIQM